MCVRFYAFLQCDLKQFIVTICEKKTPQENVYILKTPFELPNSVKRKKNTYIF